MPVHSQGVIHRDIKPDNLLLTEDDVLKIADFGVSEVFSKEPFDTELSAATISGEPTIANGALLFLPPELCGEHGPVSGKAADICSMGVCLYCLRFGQLPFEKSGILELYESIRNDEPDLDLDQEPEFIDLMRKILEKDPGKRIRMAELREHPWVTKNGTDPLSSAEENTANLVEPPSKIEVGFAMTPKLRHLLVVMKSVQKFKNLLNKKTSEQLAL